MIGKKAELKVEHGELTMRVRIMDVKTAYGMKRLLVEPVAGTGSKWVSVERLTIV